MFEYFTFGARSIDVSVEDFFKAIAEKNETVIEEYFEKTFNDLKKEIIAVQKAKGKSEKNLSEIGGDDIMPAIAAVVADPPQSAVTKENEDFLLARVKFYERKLAAVQEVQQKRREEIFKKVLSWERLQQIAEGEGELTEMEEKNIDEMMASSDYQSKGRLLDKDEENFGMHRSIAQFLYYKIENAAHENGYYVETQNRCAIM